MYNIATSTEDKTIKVWDVNTGKGLAMLNPYSLFLG
jgi:WD40 repeat protein